MGSFPDTLAPFVPTPHDVVDRMLLLAEVTLADTVYDLGCGDGRIIVAAAQKYGARGVGVDIQAGMMEMTLENIAHAGVGNLVEFRMQDAQTVDLRPATVITLCLVHLLSGEERTQLPAAGRRLLSPVQDRSMRAGIINREVELGMDGTPRQSSG